MFPSSWPMTDVTPAPITVVTRTAPATTPAAMVDPRRTALREDTGRLPVGSWGVTSPGGEFRHGTQASGLPLCDAPRGRRVPIFGRAGYGCDQWVV